MVKKLKVGDLVTLNKETFDYILGLVYGDKDYWKLGKRYKVTIIEETDEDNDEEFFFTLDNKPSPKFFRHELILSR
jgi:hypothetical protein